MDPTQKMLGGNDRLPFTINKDLQPLKINNKIFSQQWPTNVVGIAWPTMCATVNHYNFYSYLGILYIKIML